MVMVVYILCVLLYLTTALGVLSKSHSDSETFKLITAQFEGKKKDFDYPKSICLGRVATNTSPFVVFFLLKTSGHYLGMGLIVNRNTVLTVADIISRDDAKPEQILVLAGCRSPWWTKYSQVRRISSFSIHDYGLAVTEVAEAWNFGKKVRPIALPDTPVKDLAATYHDEIGLFGITISDFFVLGRAVSKSLNYLFSVHKIAEPKVCGREFKDVQPSFNEDVHTCLQGNVSFCLGCLGSPVVALKEDSTVDLVGIVIKTSCRFQPHNVVMVKLHTFKTWILSSYMLSKS